MMTVKILIWCAGLALWLALARASGGHRSSDNQHASEPRAKFELPKMFDFKGFKVAYDKSYASVTEELMRMKLFLSRAFRSFVSKVSYKYKKSSHWLGINSHSDWTPAEIRATYLRPKPQRFPAWDRVAPAPPVSSSDDAIENKSDDQKETINNNVPELVSLDDIKRTLERIEEHADEPGYVEMAAELNELKGSRTSDMSLRRTRRSTDLQPDNMDRFNYIGPEYRPISRHTMIATDSSTDSRKFEGNNFIGLLMKDFVGGLNELFGPDTAETRNVDAHPDVVWIDHRKTNCFVDPQDQGKCGSCYAFATTSMIEWALCNATGTFVKFSEQYAVDCGPRFHQDLKGCRGGVVQIVADFFSNYGLELASNYPYVARQQQCPYNDGATPSSMGYMRLDLDMMTYIPLKYVEFYLQFGPMLMNISPRPDFHEYGGGVDGGQCGRIGIHSVVLVGHGREDGNEYWLFRNSHGTSYGELGYYKLNKRSKCISSNGGYTLGRLNEHPSHPSHRSFSVLAERNPKVSCPIKVPST